MKITKKGTPKGEKIWIGRCRECNSEAEAKQSELNITYDQRDGDFAWHKCPVCHAGNNDDGYGGMLFYSERT